MIERYKEAAVATNRSDGVRVAMFDLTRVLGFGIHGYCGICIIYKDVRVYEGKKAFTREVSFYYKGKNENSRMGGRRMKISDRESVAKNYGRKRMQFSDGLATAL
ncbi:hypothetical protein Tco_0729885 [Tanacetum coccineum]|uniref:Uncharacterized protein n=1 Tax=Tanacetum coccineum TaxID=301880 RepID=A0ABQ4YQ67_9ASTR